jgi:hypothetical protein
MKKLYALLAGVGVTPWLFWLIVVCLAFAVCGLVWGYCGSDSPQIAPVNEATIQEINSKNTETRQKALDKALEEADAPRRISDEKREEIKQKIEQKAKTGATVTAEDFRKLLREDENEW